MTKRMILEGQEAIDLWLQGEEKWNKWVKKNPEADINFSGIDFGEFELHEISFAKFCFPKGKISFRKAFFGDSNLNFSYAFFHEGEIDFSHARFGDGNIIFSDVFFGDDNIYFNKVKFGNGDIYFFGANFGEGEVDFSDSSFGVGDIYFTGTNFGKGGVHFSNTTIQNGKLDFSDTLIEKGDINFYDSTFCKCKINFSHIKIKEGNLNWNNIIQKSNSKYNFNNIKVNGEFYFSLNSSKSKYSIQKFLLQDASLDGPIRIDASFDCIPDLRGSKVSHHVNLSKVKINPSTYETLNRNEDFTEKASKLCRLKEIAENNKDHGAALRFHAAERRTIRHSGTLPKISQFIDLSFDKMSHYGQSLERPLIGLVGIFTIFWLLYLIGARLLKQTSDLSILVSEAFSLSLSSMLAFLPISRDMRQDATTILFGDNPAWYIDVLFLSQAGLSFLFLFLLGLGLRNRFRL